MWERVRTCASLSHDCLTRETGHSLVNHFSPQPASMVIRWQTSITSRPCAAAASAMTLNIFVYETPTSSGACRRKSGSVTVQ